MPITIPTRPSLSFDDFIKTIPQFTNVSFKNLDIDKISETITNTSVENVTYTVNKLLQNTTNTLPLFDNLIQVCQKDPRKNVIVTHNSLHQTFTSSITPISLDSSDNESEDDNSYNDNNSFTIINEEEENQSIHSTIKMTDPNSIDLNTFKQQIDKDIDEAIKTVTDQIDKVLSMANANDERIQTIATQVYALEMSFDEHDNKLKAHETKLQDQNVKINKAIKEIKTDIINNAQIQHTNPPKPVSTQSSNSFLIQRSSAPPLVSTQSSNSFLIQRSSAPPLVSTQSSNSFLIQRSSV